VKKPSKFQVLSFVSVVAVCGTLYGVSKLIRHTVPVNLSMTCTGNAQESSQIGVETWFDCEVKELHVTNNSGEDRWIFDKNGSGFRFGDEGKLILTSKDTDLASVTITNYDPCHNVELIRRLQKI
jgi:hypothetical protein